MEEKGEALGHLMGMETGDEVSLFFILAPLPKERVCSFLPLDGLCVLALSSHIWSPKLRKWIWQNSFELCIAVSEFICLGI